MSEISSSISWRRCISDFFIIFIYFFIFLGLQTLWCNVSSSLPPLSQFIEPCRSDRWTAADMKLYLTHYTNSAHILDTFKWVYVLLFCQAYQVECSTSAASFIKSQGGDVLKYSQSFVECFGKKPFNLIMLHTWQSSSAASAHVPR